MEDLFYSKKDKTLFYIAGYTDNSSFVNKITKMLKDGAKKLATIAKVPAKEVKTMFVTKSSRYKMMRVFFITDYTKTIPKDAFILSDKDDYWDMYKWLEN